MYANDLIPAAPSKLNRAVWVAVALLLLVVMAPAAFAAGCGDTSRDKANCYCPRGGCPR